MDELTSLFVFLAICAATGAGVWLGHRGIARSDGVRRAWERVAERLGGRLRDSEPATVGATDVQIVARIGDRVVTVSAEREALVARRPPTMVTRVRAPDRGAMGLRLRVGPEAGWTALGKTLGIRDLEIGDDDFDDAYMIEASNEDLARIWLTEKVRRGIERCAPYRFEVLDGEVRATLDGLDEDVGRLETVVKHVALCAEAGQALLRDTKRLAAEIEGVLSARGERWGLDGGVLIVAERAGSQILVDWVMRSDGAKGERVFTRIRGRAPDVTEVLFVIQGQGHGEIPEGLAWLPVVAQREGPFGRAFTLLSDAGEEMAEWLTESQRERVVILDPAIVTGDGHEVTVILVGLVLDSRQVLGAVELALDLAIAGVSGPYR